MNGCCFCSPELCQVIFFFFYVEYFYNFIDKAFTVEKYENLNVF